jgi:hypothetical protein
MQFLLILSTPFPPSPLPPSSFSDPGDRRFAALGENAPLISWHMNTYHVNKHSGLETGIQCCHSALKRGRKKIRFCHDQIRLSQITPVSFFFFNLRATYPFTDMRKYNNMQRKYGTRDFLISEKSARPILKKANEQATSTI